MQQFLTQDKLGGQISIEFEIVDPLSIQFSEKLALISDSLSRAYVSVESQFARQFPESLSRDKFLNSLEPFFKDGVSKVEWPLVEENIENILRKFFGDAFSKSLSANKEVCSNFTHFLIVAKEKNSPSPLGAIYCMMSNTESEQTIRVPIFGVAPEAQSRGIGKILMSSILKQIPNVKKIALSTRITNEKALKAYRAWGFVSSPNTIEHWANLEYSVEYAEGLK